MGVIKVKPWGKDQGDHVLIEAEDFNPDFHQMHDEEKPKAEKPKAKTEEKPKAE